jgi:hypothetical protein
MITEKNALPNTYERAEGREKTQEKTIVLTAFEGVEVRNLLRTDVVKTLLADTRVRVIALVKSEERQRYGEKHFPYERLSFVVAPYDRSLGVGLDRFFSKLKFLLLNTETTRLRRTLEARAGTISTLYARVMTLMSTLLARPSLVRLARWCDARFVKDRQYIELFDTYTPDLVLLAHLFESPEVHILREAKRRNVASVSFINSWDKVTGRCVLRLLPDSFIVFNEAVKDELVVHDSVDPRTILIGGMPQYDMYSEPLTLSRAEFFAHYKLDASHYTHLLVMAPIGKAFSDFDERMIDLMLTLHARGSFGAHTALLIRFAPNDFVDDALLARLTGLAGVAYEYPGTRLSHERGVDWDMDEDDNKILKQTMHYASVVVCYFSSLSLDAAICDTPVINIAFNPPTQKDVHTPEMESIRQRIGTQKECKGEESASHLSPLPFATQTHYAKALAVGGIALVHSEDELVERVTHYLTHPEADTEARHHLAHLQAHDNDGKAGERIGTLILSLMR